MMSGDRKCPIHAEAITMDKLILTVPAKDHFEIELPMRIQKHIPTDGWNEEHYKLSCDFQTRSKNGIRHMSIREV